MTIEKFSFLRGGPFAEDVDADVGEVEGDPGGEGGVYWEGEAGEVDEGGDGSGDEGGVAGVLFEALDEAADAVVFAADFLLEEVFEGEFGSISKVFLNAKSRSDRFHVLFFDP